MPAAPDPTPPGVPDATFSAETNAAFEAWQQANNAIVAYEDVPWPQLHDKMAANFASGVHTHDVVYMSGWVPEFADFLVPFVDKLPSGPGLRPAGVELLDGDLGRPGQMGVVFTLSLLTTFYNQAMFDAEGHRRSAQGLG